MNIKNKFVFFLLLFLILFTIIGDAYIYFLDGNIFTSDFKVQTKIEDRVKYREYVRELERYSDELDLKIYKVTAEITGKNTATYTVYAWENQKDFLKRRNLLRKDESVFRSIISGERKVVFKPFMDSINDNYSEYYIFGTKENATKLRSLIIDKYGMTRLEENHYPSDSTFMIVTAWLSVFLVIVVYILFEVNSRKKEFLLRYLNGTNKKELLIPFIVTNTIIIICAFGGGIFLAAVITEATKFIWLSLLGLIITLIASNILYFPLLYLEVRQTLVRSNYSLKYKILSFLALAFISLGFIFSLTFNFKNMHDSILTLQQKEKWKTFSDYDNIAFFFREESETTNFETDEQHTIKFYNDYLDKYQMHLSFDFAINDAVASGTANVNSAHPIVYLNKYALQILAESGIDTSGFKRDQYYIISNYTEGELQENGIYAELSWLMDGILTTDYESMPFEPEIITIDGNYKLLLYDINVNNLADNYKKNPIIIFDNHSVLPKIHSYNVFGSLIKFRHESDFNNFINEIGYQNEVYFKNNVYDLYVKKQGEKTLVLTINVILSSLMMVLFTATLAAILKMDFDARAIEVSLGKIFGKSLFSRYKGLFSVLISSVVVGVFVSLLGKFFFHNFSWLYVFLASLAVLSNMVVVLALFINKYEKVSIPKVLKGGV